MYKKQHIHFVGIGGIGMSGLAQVLLTLGYSVSGSDLRSTLITKRLAAKGASIYQGHRPENVVGADVVVVSSAVRADNPEVVAAKAADIPIIPRAEMLGELMRFKKFGVAVAGAHGKTSTTSMIASVFQAAELDPTVIIGGQVKGLGTNAYWGKGDFLVAEADESDGSFLRLTPSIVVVTNIDREHLDFYSGIEDIKANFARFIDKIPFYGVVIACGDDQLVREVLANNQKRHIIYGTGDGCELRACCVRSNGIGVSFGVEYRDTFLGEINLTVPGIHHVRNALASVALGLELEIDFEKVKQGLENYSGVGRRFELLGTEGGITVVDDYAHHPTEIRATLQAARQIWPDRRFVVLFEPHRYTRTQALMDEFSTCFVEADELWLTEIYPASEKPIVGVSGQRLARQIMTRTGQTVHFVQDVAALPQEAISSLREGDVVFTLGAGAIGKIGPRLVELLRGGRIAAAF